MKTFGTVLILLAVVQITRNSHAIQSRSFEGSINSTMECFRQRMNDGFPQLGLPHFNPFIIDDMVLNFTALGVQRLSGHLRLKHTMLTGITKWEVCGVSGTICLVPLTYTIRLIMTFPQIILDTMYCGAVKFNSERLFGNGSLNFDVTDVSLNVSLKFTIIGETKLRYFHVIPSISKFNAFQITGLNGKKKYSKCLSCRILDEGPELMEGISEDLDEFIGRIVVELANRYEDCGPFCLLLNRCGNFRKPSI